MSKYLNKKNRVSAGVVILVASLFFVQVNLFAAKGDAKAKKGYVLKFNGFELKSFNSLNFLMQPGVMYKGSFSTIQKAPQQVTIQSVITYQKGNTSYIIPYSHKVQQKFKTPEKPKF
jgi:hypothetical protein